MGIFDYYNLKDFIIEQQKMLIMSNLINLIVHQNIE